MRVYFHTLGCKVNQYETQAMRCVAATYTGPYEGIHAAYDAVCSYLAAHPEWRVCGPSVERYIRDEGMVSDPAELVSAVLFPVERAK